jgi:geranylgeranyl pyrophosphate synthase
MSVTPEEAVERVLGQIVAGLGDALLVEMGTRVLRSGGKRLRARLALQVGAALGADSARVAPFAAVCELLHSASLVHDDLQDRDERRRDRATTWVEYGEAHAVTLGDAFILAAYDALALCAEDDGMRWRLCGAVTRAGRACAAGQCLEMRLGADALFDFKTYARAARGKTGALVALPAEGAALLSGHDAAQSRAVSEVFETLGLLFQMADDVLDLSAHKGRPPGSDLQRGKVTALVVGHVARNPEAVGDVRALVAAPPGGHDADTVSAWSTRLRRDGALDWLRARFDEEAERLRAVPVLRANPSLGAVVEAFVDRVSRDLRPAS